MKATLTLQVDSIIYSTKKKSIVLYQ